MVLSRKSRSKLSSNHKILLKELEELTVEVPQEKTVAPLAPINTPGVGAQPLRTSAKLQLKQGLTPQPKKKPGRPKGPSLINTSKLLTG